MLTTYLLIAVLVFVVIVLITLLIQVIYLIKVNTRLDEFNRQANTQAGQGEARIQRLETIFRGLEKDLREDVDGVRVKVDESLEKNSRQLGERVKELIQTNRQQLSEISGKVEERLDKGFEKTTTVFADVLKRLALIDKAQEKIAELSGNVISLQEVLSDKRARGALGEIQLEDILSNMMPRNSYSLQYTFDNGVRADCVLTLPQPTGKVCIDSKFPLESYQRMTDTTLGDADRKSAERQFRQDIKKHIKDISSKYIIPGKTSNGAIMFIPAEAVFAEIHGHYRDLVEEAQNAHVWLASPTTMMAVLTTSRAVLKDAAMREQAQIIQDHLNALSVEFDRFKERMDKLAKNIRLAHANVDDVKITADKISKKFDIIENVEFKEDGVPALEESEA